MEGKKESGSSFITDLFEPKENPTDLIFDAIFRPSCKGREALNSSEFQKNGSGSQPWKAENAVADQNGVEVGGQNQGTASKDKGPYSQKENVHQPFHFHYSSSIYYGGPDLYPPPQTVPSPFFTTFNKDGEDDESGYASRGNWWKGSLYY